MHFADLVSQLDDPTEAAALLRSTFEQTRMAMIATDPRQPDNPIVAVNAAFETLTGYAEDEIVGRNCRFLQGAETDPAEVARLRACVAAREAGSFELLNHRKDGTPFWNALHVGPVFDAKGELAFFFATQRDVTERVEALRALRGERRKTDRTLRDRDAEVRRLYDAIDQAKDGMALTEYAPIDPPGPRFTWVSRGFEQMTGYAAHELIGKSPRILQGERTDRDALDRVREGLESGEGVEFFRTINYRRDGAPYHVEWSISPVRNAEGEPTHWLSVQRDVTEQVEREREALMAAELEHRHRNVFSLVSAVIGLMPAKDRTAADFKQQVTDKMQALVAAHDLVFSGSAEEVAVADLAAAVLAPFPEDQLRLSVDDTRIAGRAALDLALALHELGTNAAKHGAWSSDAGTVTLTCWDERSSAQPALWFDWIEEGGPAVKAPQRRGFGSAMLRALLNSDHRPDAGIDYEPGGVVCRGGVAKT